jgi:hypothetical protein
VIRLGLRLTVNGGREAMTRLLVTAAAVGLGVGMLLLTLAGVNGVNAQNGRYAWLSSGQARSTTAHTGASAASAATGQGSNTSPEWWQLRADRYQGKVIGRVDIAPTGPNAPVPPGIPRLPGPGQYYVSPALAKLIASTPADQLATRYGSTQVGIIGDAALPAPNSLIVIAGDTVAQLSRAPYAHLTSSISTTSPSSCNGSDCAVGAGIDANGIDLILAAVACTLLFPVLIFVATATRLSAARREQRFAAMRLVGATRRQLSAISAVESTVASIVGVALGFASFYALRGPVASIPFTGAPFFASDLTLNAPDVLAVVIGIPVAALVAARLALRRVDISPLGVTRQVTPKAPSPLRMIVLLAGLVELGYFAIAGRPKTTGQQTMAYTPGIMLVMLGLIIGGPWLTMAASRLVVRRTRRASTLIAGRRLTDNPRGAFRSVSGLILALFAASVGFGIMNTINTERGPNQGGAAGRATVIYRVGNDANQGLPSVSPALRQELASIPGVEHVMLTHVDTRIGDSAVGPPGRPADNSVASCADLTQMSLLGTCAPGAVVGRTGPFIGWLGDTKTVYPPAALSTAALAAMPVNSIAVRTDGSTAAVERARTVLGNALPLTDTAQTISEWNSNSQVKGWDQLLMVMMLCSLPIAGCTLAAGIAGSLGERKRPFSLLRLTGVPLRVLRRVVLLESVVPLVTVSVISVVAGFVSADLFVRSQLRYSLDLPGVGFYGVAGGGLVAALAIIMLTLPLLRRVTGPEAARNE